MTRSPHRTHHRPRPRSQPRPGRSGMLTAQRLLPAVVGLFFFLSGAAGLVYEVLWIRIIDKVIGSAPFAVATVLTVFMAGLGLGSLVAGRLIDNARSSLLAVYGKLELGIAICALAVPFGIQALLPLYQALYDRLLPFFWWYQAAAFAGCALVLVVPAALMGATLPVLCRYYVRRHDHVGTRTGWLYGLNTVGAALGVVLCGFLLIQTLGVQATLLGFAALNGLIGILCLLLSRIRTGERPAGKTGGPIPESIPESIPEPLPEPNQDSGTIWPLAVFAVSGVSAMAYEVLWTRLLGLIAGPTTYCFSIVVATFIIGLALGSMIFGHLSDKVRDPAFWLIITQMGAAAAAMATSQILGTSQFLFAKLIWAFQDRFTLRMFIQALVLFAVMLPPTLCSGAAFPLVNRICSRSTKTLDTLGRSVGTAYALNTLGALTGSFLAGFLLIPWLGKAGGLRLVIFLQFSVSGIWLLYRNTRLRKKGAPGLAVAAGILLAGWTLMSQFPAWQTELLSRGWYRDFAAIEADLQRTGWARALFRGPQRIAGRRQGLTVVFKGEGPAGFTTVEKEVTSLGNVEYALFNSGKADASSHGDCSTQALSAHIPLLFHPGARNVMVLGLASGMTAGEVLLYPVEKLDIVEINQEVVTACDRFFGPWNNQCLEDPRTRMIVQDGRNHLALTKEVYDIIISEPSNPWMAGLANLYTLEFYLQARQRLTGHGLFAQWIQAYEMDWETFSLLGRTFATAFPRSALIKVGPVDYLLLGHKDPNETPDWQAARKHCRFAATSTNVAFPENPEFLAHLFLTEDLPGLFGPGPLHTDNHPFLEFSAPKMLYSKTLLIDRLVAGRSRLTPATLQVRQKQDPMGSLLDLVIFNASANVPMFNLLPLERLNARQQARYKQTIAGYCSRVLIPTYAVFNDDGLKAGCAAIQVRAIRHQLDRDQSRAIDHYNLALGLAAQGQNQEAAQSLRRAVSLNPDNDTALTTLGLLLAKTGDYPEAAERLSRAAELCPGAADPRKYLGMVERRQGKTDKAVADLTAALALAPEDVVILSELGALSVQQGRYRDAIDFLSRALKKAPADREARYYMQLAQKGLDAGTTDSVRKQ